MESTISIKKVTQNNHEYPAIRFNPDEEIGMHFVQEAVFALILSAIQNLDADNQATVLRSIRENMLNIFNKSEEEVFDFFVNQCKVQSV
jgi:predicted nucleic acid-binding protein